MKLAIFTFLMALVASGVMFGSIAKAQTNTITPSPTDSQTPSAAPRTGLGGMYLK